MGPRLDKLRRHLPAVGSPSAYLSALGFLAIGVLVRLPLDPDLNSQLPPYLTIYPAVVLSSFVSGMRAGGFVALLGLLIAIYLWIPPYNAFVLPSQPVFVLGAYAIAMSISVAACGLGRHLLDQVSALEAERTQQARETVHRIKNLIAVVQAIAVKVSRQSATTEEFRRDFSIRMAGLGVAQDVLIRTEWEDTDLQGLVRAALAPFLPNPALHIIGGPPVKVRAQFVGGLCMALYELATNALKHGALSANPGAVDVSWRIEERQVVLSWSELSESAPPTGGPSSGLGSSLIRSALNNASDTRVEYEVATSQVRAVFRWPL